MPSVATPAPQQNRLLAALPAAARNRLIPHLERVDLSVDEVLYESGVTPNDVYFLTDAVVSLVYPLDDGSAANITTVGNEGVIGIALCVGDENTPSYAIVQKAGLAYRLGAKELRQELHRKESKLRQLLLRYALVLTAQLAQTSICNRYHSMTQQLCRWLLLSLDRQHTRELRMTHRLISNLLGVRRESVSGAAAKLQEAGVIRYSRGHLTILDRAMLLKQSCECYAVIKNETNRLMPRAIT